jgi:predicted ATPase/DNA-binding winged helix-turn-helix (wHTH) protein
MMKSPPQREVASFGPFQLVPSERVLLKDGRPMELGSRSLDLLVVLVERANEIVGKRELLSRVWPDSIVEEGSLRFHMVNLRKALGDGVDGVRYITTVAGRGYCFVAPTVTTTERTATPEQAVDSVSQINLPSRLQRMVGRALDVHSILARLAAERFVTIAGSGGVGKTTVAVAVAHDLAASFAGGVIFVDLGSLSDPRLIATTLASLLGLSLQSDEAMPALIAHLRDRHVLLILDTCEHVIDAAAELASQLFDATPRVHILATSREALRVEGEHVYRLESLEYPPADTALTAAAVHTFPAMQLFIERAQAKGIYLDISDADAEIVAGICRRLDGVALAIELAAGRVRTYGLHKTAELLDKHLTLLWPGQRTAPARQRTLHAMLEWSYELLSNEERTVLRRLAVFVGYFTFEAALQVAIDANMSETEVFQAIESLIDKSLLATQPLGAMMRYRLLDTTRAYATQLHADAREQNEVATRHAVFYRCWLSHVGMERPNWSSAAERVPHLAAISNVRAALQWCFSPTGDNLLGVALAAAAAPVFLAMSLLTECYRWSVRALEALPEEARGGADEMYLQAGIGMSLMFTRDHGEAARDAFLRSLSIAEKDAEPSKQLLLLGPLHMFHYRSGEFRQSFAYAKRSADVAAATGDPASVALAHCLLGVSLHSMGELASARVELEATLSYTPGSPRSRMLHLGFDYYNWAGAALARTLWMQGFAEQAVERGRQAIQNAEDLGHPVALTMGLHWVAAVHLWAGDLESAETHIDRFLSRAATHSFGPYIAVGHGLKGEIAIRRGDAAAGVAMLSDALTRLHAVRYELVTTALSIALAEGLGALERSADAIDVIDETIRNVETNGDFAYMPELLRVKSGLLLRMRPADPDAAESYLRESLDWSRRQLAKGWELRAATDMAALLIGQRRPAQAIALLAPLLEHFAADVETIDVRAARHVHASAAGQGLR